MNSVEIMEAKLDKGLEFLESLKSEFKTANKQLCTIERNSNEGVKYMVWHKERKEKMTVFVRVSFVSVGDIDAVKQEFRCEFYLNLKWEEPEFTGVSDAATIDWNSSWDPGMYIVDAVSYDIYERHQTLQMSKRLGGIPFVRQYYHIKGTFKEVLEVNNFPFDYQDLALMLTSNWHAEHLVFAKDQEQDDNIHTWNFTAQQEWNLKPHVLAESKTLLPVPPGSSPNSYPQYRIRINVMRYYSFHLTNVALIMCLITMLTFTSFTVEADAVGDRIQIVLTLLLTSIAFKYYVQQFLPTVSYTTFLDKYIMTCMGFQFFMAIFSGVSGMTHGHTDVHGLFEWNSFAIAVIVFLLIHVVFGSLSYHHLAEAKASMKRDESAYKDSKIKKQESESTVISNGNANGNFHRQSSRMPP